MPDEKINVDAGQWSNWVDLRKWPLHGRMDRVGGLAEWSSGKVKVSPPVQSLPQVQRTWATHQGCAFDVQLADKADPNAVVISFSEKSESDTIGFLLPTPLREHAKEFETGSQMTARQLKWAQEITGGKAPSIKHFDICTSLWGPYDPALARQNLQTIKLLGFNVSGGTTTPLLREAGMNVASSSWDYLVDPDESTRKWNEFREKSVPARKADPDGAWEYAHMRFFTVSDEIGTLSFKEVEKKKRDGWFREYLRQQHVSDTDLGKPVDQVDFPQAMMEGKHLPRDADLPTRRAAYFAAKFGHWWSVQRLRQAGEGVHAALPGLKTEALPTSHGFFNGSGPPHLGMSYKLLDLFEIASQHAVDILAAEDWLGLNHMYNEAYTWTGAQSFEYLNAIMRSAIAVNEGSMGKRSGTPRSLPVANVESAPATGKRVRLPMPPDSPMTLMGLITPSDDQYLRLKAYSCLGQGAKTFFFWTFGPTYIGTENYWSDLRSEYEGIARFTRMLGKAEDVLWPAQPVSDRVAILYSVSHDIWYPDLPAAFVEKRLLWHALRHLGVQPDFLREEDVETGRLDKYQALFVADWCVSRKASAAIGEWTKHGGVLYLSGGAATRDEFNEPFTPAFAKNIWADPAHLLQQEGHSFNERTDLPNLEPMTLASVDLGGTSFKLPVLGCRLDLRDGIGSRCAAFDDNKPAGTVVEYGQGKVVALGFMPMLAYGQLAGFQPKTLAEKWPAEPRRIIQYVLDRAGVKPVARPDQPVVEASLLTGPNGSALVLANYTYHPIPSLSVDVTLPSPIKSATSCEGAAVRVQKTQTGVRITMPLDWTDVVLLDHE